jgi:DNA primase
LADHHGITKITIIFDRDRAGKNGAKKAVQLLKEHGLEGQVFDWEAPVAKTKTGKTYIPKSINDLAEMNTTQIIWLRSQGLL